MDALFLQHFPLIFVGGVGFQMLGRNCHMQPFGHCMICHLHAMGSPSCSANSSYKILVTPACLASKEGREFHELIMESGTQSISKRTRKFPACRVKKPLGIFVGHLVCRFSLN